MFNLPAAEILFFLNYDREIVFNLPPGIVCPEPATYFIKWLSDYLFHHDWASSDGPSNGAIDLGVEDTMRFIQKNRTCFVDPLGNLNP